jgi:hypothetical protein
LGAVPGLYDFDAVTRMKKSLRIQPLSHIYDLSQAGFNANPLTGQWPSMNVLVSSNRVERRWDHEVYRTFASGDTLQAVPIFRTNDGTEYVLALTETDLVKLMGATTSDTYQYLTNTWNTGTVSNIVTTAVTGTDANCQWLDSSGAAAGDMFILDSDHSAAIEPDSAWTKIASIQSNTGITLSSAYAGVGTSGAYKIRKVHSVPSGERWQFASVNGKFCFVNGNVRAQYWNGTDTYSTDIGATDAQKAYCNKARYCVSYANRLVIADMNNVDSPYARNPWLVRWSKEGDPTDWTDSTAGFNDFIDTEEPITGLGVAGSNLIVFKKTSYYIGYRTGDAASPMAFPSNKRGIGLYAPYSLVHVAGTVAWMGMNDFYYLNGDNAESIGDPIRKKFFELVADDELTRVFGINNNKNNEVLWAASTSAGQYIFAYNWKEKSWATYEFDNNLTAFGGFGI